MSHENSTGLKNREPIIEPCLCQLQQIEIRGRNLSCLLVLSSGIVYHNTSFRITLSQEDYHG